MGMVQRHEWMNQGIILKSVNLFVLCVHLHQKWLIFFGNLIFALHNKIHSLDLKKNMIAPLSISKFLDKINEIINKKKHAYKNIELNNNFVTNTNTKEKNYLTQAENLILYKLFSERIVNKKLLERDVLEIKQDLNTSSIESHLNRIRKKLKKINSDFYVSSKNNNVFLEIINPDK